MPFHNNYADGSPRPLLRGWLHGMGALTFIPLVYMNWNDIPTPATPAMIAICCVFVFSSLVHLVPWKSEKFLEALTRVDKSCILAVCVTSFMAPQLLESEACKPDFSYSLATVAIPVTMSIIGVLCGLGPVVFASCGIAFASIFWFYGLQVDDSEFFYCSVGCLVLYGLGLSLYAGQVGGHKSFWGYHEWMHLIVTLGIAVNTRGVFVLSSYTDEICSTGSIVAESATQAGLFDDLLWLGIQ
ncbi:expressed unknown protein [Seminavis robusta]|uniref:Uncharacterized protein n=1 Tax=Seminavis robusta TaxID=568900 RepID=A0A9N8EI07_9STRA|nr:expressed unknown protein [Seminavis robusta]|eukprot:Sro1131_g244650.1 n/a (242) ;mRNA; r:18427-19152